MGRAGLLGHDPCSPFTFQFSLRRGDGPPFVCRLADRTCPASPEAIRRGRKWTHRQGRRISGDDHSFAKIGFGTIIAAIGDS